MRKTVTLALYLVVVDLLSLYLVVFPAYAFQVSSSTTGYVRVAPQSAVTAMVGAQRAAMIASASSFLTSSTAGSIGVRLVAGSLGWPVLGVVAGVTLAMLYYDATKTAAIKAAAAGPGAVSIPGYTFPAGVTVTAGVQGAGFNSALYDAYFSSSYMPSPPAPNAATCNYLTLPNGWIGPYSPGTGMTGHCIYLHYAHASYNASDMVVQPAGEPTPTQIQNYIGNLPASDPNSIESNTLPIGSQVQPTPADQTASNPVPASALPTSVVPATDVLPTDLVIDANAPAPTGTQQTQTKTQQTTGTTTETTTTTTNPDGSVTTETTKSEEETSTASCTVGNHDQRSFGSILQDHMNLWAGSGLLSALNLLKNLTWPTGIPTYSLQSSLLGNFTLDFSAWGGMLTAIRSIIIAVASFVAYRIIFVGSK